MSGTLLTPPGLLGSTQPAAQPGAGLGSLYNMVNGAMQGPAATWGGSAPAPAPTPLPTYDQWGRIQGAGSAPAATPNLNTGPGLPQQAQGGGLAGLYDQWGRPTPQSVALAAAQSQQAAATPALDPMTQNIVDAIASGNPQQGAMLGQILGGRPTPSWQGLLGAAVGGQGGGAGAGGDRGPSQGNQGQQDAATAAGGMAASGDKGPSAGGGTAASGHDQDEEGPF